MQTRPEGWEEMLEDLINSNKTYEDVNAALKKLFGDEAGALSGATYRERKAKLVGGAEVDEKIAGLRGRKQVKPQKAKPAWTKQKQTAADTSKLAQIINMGIYQGMMPMCANRELKEEHVQEINPGGAIVANISYFFPESKLEHPLIMLGIRLVILYIKFKSVCSRIEKTTKTVLPFGSSKDGLKPGLKTERRT